MTDNLAQLLLGATDDIRYVAVYSNGELSLHSRDGLRNASASESDKYEELLVNPTLLTLTRQRGEIDCGGLEYVLVRYGNFFQLVRAVEDGHVSVAIEPTADVMQTVTRVMEVLRDG